MAWAPMYGTLVLLKAHLRITDTTDDTALTACLTAASRAIDYECNRQFGVSTAVARYYTYDCGLQINGRPALAVDDIQSTTSLAVVADTLGTYTWTTTLTLGTDFDLWPYNAVANGKPWTHLVMRSYPGANYLPTSDQGLKITGLWGWTAVPDVVTSASLMQAARFFVRRDSVFGVAGSPDLGNEMRLLARLDPDVALLLTSVKRTWAAV